MDTLRRDTSLIKLLQARGNLRSEIDVNWNYGDSLDEVAPLARCELEEVALNYRKRAWPVCPDATSEY